VSRSRLRLASLLVIVFAVSSIVVPLPLVGAQSTVRLIVTFDRGTDASRADRAAEASGGRVVERIPQLDARVVELPAAAVSHARAAWASDPSVAAVEEDGLVRADWAPTDPLWSSQWEQRQVRLPRAWNTTRGTATTVVAVVDTGVQYDHPDLVGQLVAGRDVLHDDKNAADDNGHGTAVAGVVAAAASNGIGVAGGCSGCRVMPIKALDANGSGYWSVAAQGIIWAADHGADVINLSFGGPTGGSTLYNAIAYAKSKGAVVVASAGNNGSTSLFYPGAFDHVLSVAASTDMDLRYSWSNHSASWVRLAAPGCTTTTILWSAYHGFCGTSAAAPVVSAIAALVDSVQPEWTNTKVEATLLRSTVATPYQFTIGGRIDAFAAVYRARYGKAPPPGQLLPGEPLLPSGTALAFAAGGHIGYQFDKNGGIIASRVLTLAAASGAETTKRQGIPNRSGMWFYVADGGLAGFWVRESANAYLAPAATPTPSSSATPTPAPLPELLPGTPQLDPAQRAIFEAGSYTGYRFDTGGNVVGSRGLGLSWRSSASTIKLGRIPGVGGTWFYVANGGLAGYWVRSTGNVYLYTEPPPKRSATNPLRPTDPLLNPAQRVRLAAGEHLGYRFSTNGTILRRRAVTLDRTSSAHAVKRMQVPGRSGWWLYIVDGAMTGYWVRESAAAFLRA
jgi:subtilisin family serine protease